MDIDDIISFAFDRIDQAARTASDRFAYLDDVDALVDRRGVISGRVVA